MSVRSCIIARQMETWAHAQAIFDVLGQTRTDADRLKNVAHIGVTTYSWSFKAAQALYPPHRAQRGDMGMERATNRQQGSRLRHRVLPGRHPMPQHRRHLPPDDG